MDVPVPDPRSGALHALVAVELGEYELEEPWGRLAEVARKLEHVELAVSSALPAPIRTFAIKDRITRASSFLCKSVEDAVVLARFLDAHLAETRRFLLDRSNPELARLRALATDARGTVCHVTWSFSTGDADGMPATTASVDTLHEGFLGQFSPVELVGASLGAEVEGGKAVLAACQLDGSQPPPPGIEARPLADGVEITVRLDVRGPAGPGYRLAQLEAALALARAVRER